MAAEPLIVAHLLQYPPWRRIGAELATHGLLRSLAGNGWRAAACARQAPTRPRGSWPATELDGVHVVPPGLADWARPDVVLHHAAHIGNIPNLARHAGAPLVTSIHGGDVFWSSLHIGQVESDLVLANSERMAEAVAGMAGTRPVVVLRPPVDPTEHQIGEPDGLCVTMVNLFEDKGPHLFYDLARRNPDVPFLAVRGGYGEQVGSDLPNVTVVPPQTDMRWVWERTRVLLVPSRHESWGMVAVEAMMAGLPVIAAGGTDDVAGLAECMGPGHAWARPDTPGAWAELLAHVYDGGWEDAAKVSIRRAAQLHPFADLHRARTALAELIGRGDMTEGGVRFRNVNTDEVVAVRPGTWDYERLSGLGHVWHRVDDEPTTAADQPVSVRPAESAAKGAWVEYAVTRGADREACERATKRALVALYGED
jgi:glycosyltransferase involved in cell wall biosynthesis